MTASILDKAIIGCFLADQATAAPQNIKAYPETDLWEFMSPAQSKSINPMMSFPIWFPWKVIPRSRVPFKYQYMCFRAVMCSKLGATKNWESVSACPRPGAYVMSRYLQSSNIFTRGHSRGMGPC